MISKNILKRVEAYIEIARALKGKHQTGQFFHVTFICRKRKVISIGINNYNKLCPEHKFGSYKPIKTERQETYIPGVHSEISAIIKAGREDCSDLCFFNIRIGNNNQIAPSKPCVNCQRVLNQLGYKAIYYFDTKGQLNVLKNKHQIRYI